MWQACVRIRAGARGQGQKQTSGAVQFKSCSQGKTGARPHFYLSSQLLSVKELTLGLASSAAQADLHRTLLP